MKASGGAHPQPLGDRRQRRAVETALGEGGARRLEDLVAADQGAASHKVSIRLVTYWFKSACGALYPKPVGVVSSDRVFDQGRWRDTLAPFIRFEEALC